MTAVQITPWGRVKERARRAIRSPTKRALVFPAVAEAKDVKFLAIEEREAAAGRVLHLEGLVFHSALAVSEIESEEDGDAMVVKLKLAPAMRGKSGHFMVDFPLSNHIHRVLFGAELALIWSDPR